jgi:uncharacterized phage protein gp47/JayE
MSLFTQNAQALQMLAQLRLLDPSISAEIGTPERKIIDTVAQALDENRLDLSGLSAALDLSSKYGGQLDRFLVLFGFGRQVATYATGYVIFERPTPTIADIRIVAGTQVSGTQVLVLDDLERESTVEFVTVYDAIIPTGGTTVTVPVRCLVPGTIGNLATGRITRIEGSTTVVGVTSVSNEVPTSGGSDSETDSAYKVRFKNTIFRNLAGTEDQFIALAISTAFTSKVNVVGPQSYYREYVQVPPVNDNLSYDINNSGQPTIGNGLANNYTTALSTIPYAKQIWKNGPAFVSNGKTGLTSIFYLQDSDFSFNTNPGDSNHGDAFRLAQVGIGTDPSTTIAPNITLKNVYSGANATVTAIRPGDTLLLEYPYLSEASRNDLDLYITNAVDVYIDGGNNVQSSMVVVRPNISTEFVDDKSSKFNYENYRRIGEPAKRPVIGNAFQATFWQPMTDLPLQIVIGDDTYTRGVHYWPVYDISNLSGTVRARNGIEWSTKILGQSVNDSLDTEGFTGKLATDATGDPAGGQTIEVKDYTYDRNIVDLQNSLIGSKQITTDILAHKAKDRFFKLDITVMYAPDAIISSVNQQINNSVDQYLRGIYFGSVVQLSDILNVIHNVDGVDNVRWSSDVSSAHAPQRIYETDINGRPLLNVSLDRLEEGSSKTLEVQGMYIVGQPTSGTFSLQYQGYRTTSIQFNASASQIAATLNSLSALASDPVYVAEDARNNYGVRNPIRSFQIKRLTFGLHELIVPFASTPNPLTGGPYIINNDFFLRDDELARLPTQIFTPDGGVADAAPGLIIRQRAQNTWTRS